MFIFSIIAKFATKIKELIGIIMAVTKGDNIDITANGIITKLYQIFFVFSLL
jgi:hypothetical protein